MFINKVILNNFRNFEGLHSFTFEKINLLTGKIGCGKSTVGRIAITFALFGEAEVNLSSLPTRSGAKNCWVGLNIIDNEQEIYIQREIPTKLTVMLNGIEIYPGSNNIEKEKWIRNRFKDYNHFKKFRMIDLRQGVNILEEGKTSLRKTLISFHEGILNNMRESLSVKKSLFERFNKDTAVIYKHYPSVKRLNFLKKSKELNQAKYSIAYKKFIEVDNDYKKLLSTLSSYKYQLDLLNKENKKLTTPETSKECPTCKQQLPTVIKTELLNNNLLKLEEVIKKIEDYELSLDGQKDALSYIENSKIDYQRLLERLNGKILKLEGRLKQKEYIYTSKDVLIATKAIKELDKIYSYVIIYCVKSLEPIINNIISKIGLKMSFELDSKSDFDIVIYKDSDMYSYKDLSSGQRLLLSIAFQIALLLDQGDTGVIIADEGFTNLDNDTMKVLYELFAQLPFQVISILHRFESETKNINLIKIEKEEIKNARTSRTKQLFA